MYFDKQKVILTGLGILSGLSPLAGPISVMAEQTDTIMPEPKSEDTAKTETASDESANKENAEKSQTEESEASHPEDAFTKEKETNDENTDLEKLFSNEKKETKVEDKIQKLAQAEPNYEIAMDESQDENVKKMIADIADKTAINQGKDITLKQETKPKSTSKVESPVDRLKSETNSVKQTIESAKATESAKDIVSLGATQYKEFNPDTKKDAEKSQENYLMGDSLVTLKEYDQTKTDENQQVKVEFRNLSSIQKHVVSAAGNSKKETVLQSAVDSVVHDDKTSVGQTDIIVRNKDVTPPEIELTSEEVNLEPGEELNPEELVAGVTDDSTGQSVDYTIDGEVNYATPGEYQLTVNATDIDGNTASENITVNVLDDFYQRIADSALSQVGRYQDCTMLVTNSLASVGINFHGWPYEYMALGSVTNNPVPGDIIVYEGHVAIYIGNGQAVHGGWLGTQTVVSSVNCTNAFIAYIHPNRI